jgi:glycosyltransferase involved in cell wall biosynthesis
VWVLHDMHPLTGGCHFAGSCHEFERACGGCPQLRNPGADDLSAETLALKASLLERLTVHVVAPSRWLTEQARRSRVMRGARSLRTIAYGLDTAVLRPLERRGAKLRLGIDPQRKVVCFGADSCANPRKGAAQLAAAWRQLGAERPLLLAFGGGQLPEALRGSELRELGYLRTAEEKAAAYSAADVFVLPSLEDNLPQTGLEAMACGTPVVAFAAGGVPDFVRHERTGLLAPTGDVAALASALTRMLEDAALRRACGRAARETVEREYAADVEAETYERLFIEAVGDQRRSAA